MRLSEKDGTVKAELTVGQFAPEGVKFVWSTNPDPVFPAGNNSRSEYRSLDELLEFTPEPFSGPGNYWVRAGWYNGSGIDFYSEPIQVYIAGTRGVQQGEGMSIQLDVHEQVARVGATYKDTKPEGFKIVWSRTPDPEYPPR